ncbi:hypothetical protein GCM10023172_42260 [Hymenobacter ginsengisoli]|uniref:HNH endonuclease n=2 Tax=Hymenobacter TaxID=89966 RepID=A0ABP8QUW8_9BACT|nr:hypothetical protein [Hymenobacter sp. BT559]MBO2034021.1 hypothetical protein [Hymenobacter sp. BT559]
MTKYDRLTQALTLGIAKQHQAERKKKETIRKRAERRAYGRKVRSLTKQQPLDQVPGIELRGPDYHLDHTVSIVAAWEAGWTPEQCADVSNLQILPKQENLDKGTASFCSLALHQRLTFN